MLLDLELCCNKPMIKSKDCMVNHDLLTYCKSGTVCLPIKREEIKLVIKTISTKESSG